MIYNSQYPRWGTKGTFHCTVWQGGQTVAQSSPDLQDLKKRTVSLEAILLSVFLRELLLTELTFFACRAYACVSNGEPDLEVSQANHNHVTWSFMNRGGESRWCWGNGVWKMLQLSGWEIQKAKYQTINTIHNSKTKVFPSLCSSSKKKRPVNSGTVHPATQQWERWDNCVPRRKKGSLLDTCITDTFLLEREGSSFAQPGLFPESLKEDFLSPITAMCTDNSSGEIYQHRGTWLRLSGSRIEYCRCDSGRSRCHTVPVRGEYEEKEKGNGGGWEIIHVIILKMNSTVREGVITQTIWLESRVG